MRYLKRKIREEKRLTGVVYACVSFVLFSVLNVEMKSGQYLSDGFVAMLKN